MCVEIWRIVLDVFGYQSWLFSSSGLRWRACILESPVSQFCLICLCAPGRFFLRIPKRCTRFSCANGLFSPSASMIWLFRGVLLLFLACLSFRITSQGWEGGSGVRSALRSLGEKGQPWKEGNPWKIKEKWGRRWHNRCVSLCAVAVLGLVPILFCT